MLCALLLLLLGTLSFCHLQKQHILRNPYMKRKKKEKAKSWVFSFHRSHDTVSIPLFLYLMKKFKDVYLQMFFSRL